MKLLLQTLFGKAAMDFFSWIARAAVLLLLASAPAAVAQIYTFTFTGSDGMDASGTISVVGGVAQSGSINVTGVPLEADPSTLINAAGSLIPGSSAVSGVAKDPNGDYVTYDSQVNVPANPLYLNGGNGGLAFGSSPYGPNEYDTLIGLNGGDAYGNIPPYEYTLFVGEAELDGSGNVIPGENEYVYTWTSGTLTLTPVPEPATDALILCALAMGFLVIRRRAAA